MSKYAHGPYHYLHYASGGSDYREHVQTVLGFIDEIQPPPNAIADMGAGEGLMVDLLTRKFGNSVGVVGFEIDPLALALARGLGNYVIGESMTVARPDCDMFLFLDVLEHVKEWKKALVWPLERAQTIIIAVPDREDPHAVHSDRLPEIIKFIGPRFHAEMTWKGHSRDGVVLTRDW